MSRLYFIFFLPLFIVSISGLGQTQRDTIYTNYTRTPVVIDGSDADSCWTKAEWHSIRQVWLGNAMASGDFAGKFKAVWDKNYLYVLVQVEDDSLSDDHTDPLDNYWNDDCVEIFIDEDRSGGNHQFNNNAFAYHCSMFYDVIDGAGKNGATINCRNNIAMKMDTIGSHFYMWEFAVKIFNENFDYSNPEVSRVFLTPNTLMGFSIAYCDNDAITSRENFIGSVIMPAGHENDSYINADYFGTMLLIDSGNEFASSWKMSDSNAHFSLYPNPASDQVILSFGEHLNSDAKVEVADLLGNIIRSVSVSGSKQTLIVNTLSRGAYLIRLTNGSEHSTRMFTKE